MPSRCGAPVVPCGCSQRTGTVRRSLRDMFGELEKDYPHLKENILSAMGNVETGRLLDPRYLDMDENVDSDDESEPASAPGCYPEVRPSRGAPAEHASSGQIVWPIVSL